MNELEALTNAVRALRQAREPFVVATVVRVAGSAYRRPGARLIVAEGRRVAGCVSGGCLEGDLVQRGFFRTERAPVVVRYDARSDDDLRDGFGIGCDGIVDVLLERGAVDPRDDDPFVAMERVLAHERPAVLATIFRADDPRLTLGTRAAIDPVEGARARASEEGEPLQTLLASQSREAGKTLAGGRDGLDLLCEYVAPPPHLFVFGAGHDVPPLVVLARQAGFRVTVCVHEARLSSEARFARDARILAGSFADATHAIDAAFAPAVVVMGHHLERDRDALAAALASRARYLGVLGPRSRTERLLGLLPALGSSITDPRLFAPAGLRLGGDSPEAVALSIVAEARAVLSARPGGHHRDHRGAIHD